MMRLRHLELVALAVALTTLGVQRHRLETVRFDLGEAEGIASVERAEKSALRDWVLRRADQVLNSGMAGPGDERASDGDVIYAVVDSRCVRSAEALVALYAAGTNMPVRLIPADETPESLKAWMTDLGVWFPIASEAREEPLINLVPTVATPTFLEIRQGIPTDLVMGMPKTSWFAHAQE